MEGKEVRRILTENKINLSWLSEQLGLTPQAFSSRLNARDFKKSYLLEITQLLNQDIFGIGVAVSTETRFEPRPIHIRNIVYII